MHAVHAELNSERTVLRIRRLRYEYQYTSEAIHAGLLRGIIHLGNGEVYAGECRIHHQIN
jgi:hypothetical protein